MYTIVITVFTGNTAFTGDTVFTGITEFIGITVFTGNTTALVVVFSRLASMIVSSTPTVCYQ